MAVLCMVKRNTVWRGTNFGCNMSLDFLNVLPHILLCKLHLSIYYMVLAPKVM